MAFCTPATTSGNGLPSASSPMISVSAKTTHTLLMIAGFLLWRPSSESFSQFISSRAATISRKRPVPAAQRSFISKSRTRPPSSRLMTLLSCPPISMMVRADGASQWTPRA